MEFREQSLISESYIKPLLNNLKKDRNLSFKDLFNTSLIKENIINNYKYTIDDSYSLFDKHLNIVICIKQKKILKPKTSSIESFFFENRIQTKDINIAIKYLFLEVYLLIESYNKKEITFHELQQKIYIFLGMKNKKQSYELSKNKNRNLLVTNNSSLEYSKTSKDLLKYEFLIKEIGLNSIEIPQSYKRREMLSFLNSLNDLKKKLKIKNLNFNLRIKRIKQYKKDGMFIKNANTIIIDPREPKAIIHEIGHYIYENGLAFNYNNKRIYKNKFQSIVNKNKEKYSNQMKIYDKYEDYDINSEIFAYWFEDSIT